MRQADAICFGSLAQRSAESWHAIQRLVAASRPSALRVFDINLRVPFYQDDVIESSLHLANVLKLNEAELPVVGRQFGLRGSAEEQVEALAHRFDLDVVALTPGAAGSRIHREGRWTAEAGRTVSVVDAVGAGDSYTAALVLGLLLRWPTSELLRRATDVAAFVCTRAGATPRLPDQLVASFAAALG